VNPDGDIEPIQTPRLELVSMSVPFMEALERYDLEAAEREIGATVPAWMPGELENFLRFRLAQLAVDPSIRIWLGRVMVLTEAGGARHVIGSLGFHGPPDEQGRLEVGYSVDPARRRQGYAIESVRALFDWAHATFGIGRFIASISPINAASLALAAQLGFEQVGEQMDEIDGLELVFETTWPRPVSGSLLSP
jgi:RimJ/RimL family protein N-acetyltransferase